MPAARAGKAWLPTFQNDPDTTGQALPDPNLRLSAAMTKESTPQDYRATLNLPDTPFPMRGDLPKREPDWVQA